MVLGMTDDLPRQKAGGIKYLACEWCGESVSQLGTRTPRLYCKKSHRQRAFEARRLLKLQDAATAAKPPQ